MHSVQPEKELKLSDFPEVFKENTLIVIGDKASEIELQAAKEIADYLEKETGNKPLIKKYSEVSDEDKRNYNLIVKGLNTYWQGNTKGYLVISGNPWPWIKSKYVLIVGGNILDDKGVALATDILLNSTLIKKLDEHGIIVSELYGREVKPISELSKLVAMDIARGYFVTRCAVIPGSGLKLEVSD